MKGSSEIDRGFRVFFSRANASRAPERARIMRDTAIKDRCLCPNSCSDKSVCTQQIPLKVLQCKDPLEKGRPVEFGASLDHRYDYNSF